MLFDSAVYTMGITRICTKEAIQSTLYAFAALLSDGHVVTWGDAKNGGDSGGLVQKSSRDMNHRFFWGDENCSSNICRLW